ncbi:MAG: hypothetical protein U0M06_11270, partial [Clostridia bacterium]|nr:hypothetical protein [Clostridia bacterium]
VHNALQDISIPFNEYTNIYLKKINRDSVFKKYKKNKRSNASVFYKRRKVDMLVAKEKVLVESKHVSKNLEDKEDYLRSLLENKEYIKLSEEFNDYREFASDHISDIEYLSKSENTLRKHSENIDSNCDIIIWKLY